MTTDRSLPPGHLALIDAALDELAHSLLLARLRGLPQLTAGPERRSDTRAGGSSRQVVGQTPDHTDRDP
jgi:hypothetical protein